MKTKQIPVLITLIAGLITCIVSFLYQINTVSFVKALFLVVIVFFVLGSVVKIVLDKNFPLEENEEQEIQEKEQEEQEEQQQKDEEGRTE